MNHEATQYGPWPRDPTQFSKMSVFTWPLVKVTKRGP